MNRTPAVQRYNLLSQLFHWSVVVLIIGLLVTNTLRGEAPKDSDLRLQYLNLHMSLGILLFFVAIARIAWSRLARQPDPVPGTRWTQVSAKIVHVALNLATLLVPISGYLRVASKDRVADFFGLVQIPSLTGNVPELNEIMHTVHGEPMEVFFYVVIGLHIVAALWHQYIRRDGALERMLPWGRGAA
jgi:superoxide oxidase